ncbi:uncharacterized protein LOC106882076 isoform X2 [Octopus bimaculoides]|uniref:uncharacterized protein LOC106882076 isoform X2 n=1 Tax=Octopus bimaculoides TaxID=37653 RepID=UPI0022E2BC88|nr:uncharacterized protein LOC106882076 isoform X2 [Octopus bimaculoides]
MLGDQENYDTFEYDKSDGEMYEPLTDTVIIPKKNAPPLPPARNKYKDFKSGSLPRNNPIPQVPDCDENYEEFPCLTQDDFMEENYECFDNDLVDNDPPLKMKPPLPDRKYGKEKPKIDVCVNLKLSGMHYQSNVFFTPQSTLISWLFIDLQLLLLFSLLYKTWSALPRQFFHQKHSMCVHSVFYRSRVLCPGLCYIMCNNVIMMS